MVKKKDETLDFYSDLAKGLDDDIIIMSEEDTAAEFHEYIDTGSYALNALMSGSIYGGVPDNKVICFNGLEATGKTFFLLSIASHFQKQKKNGGIVLFDTEQDKRKQTLIERGIDISRVMNTMPITVQEFRHKCLKILDAYLKVPESKRPPTMMLLDSLGQLSTTKEVEDTATGSETKDMTKPGVIKSAFRMIRPKLAKANIPLLVANHVYTVIGGGNYAGTEAGGGTGPKYTGDIIIDLSKAQFKEKDNEPVSGSVIKCKTYKSRLTREKQTCLTLLRHNGGLDRYYGLINIAEAAGIVTRTTATGKTIKWFNDKQYSEKVIYADPETYFTPENMEKIEKAAGDLYKFTNTAEDYKLSDD